MTTRRPRRPAARRARAVPVERPGALTRIRLLLPLLAAACSVPPWSRGQVDEAYRLCRAEVGFPPISVFQESGAGFGTFMCQCEVSYLSSRVPHEEFGSGLYLDKVNRVLFNGRTACMARYRGGER